MLLGPYSPKAAAAEMLSEISARVYKPDLEVRVCADVTLCLTQDFTSHKIMMLSEFS